MSDIADIKSRLRRHGCDVVLNHLDQAESALARGESESASAQVRSAVEALFDRAAELRLRSTKRGGAARKELEAAGLLSEKEARLVQAFVDFAGTGGSHAGRSSADEATGRFLAAIGLLLVGLSLFPDLVKVEQAMAALKPPPADDQITASCRICNTVQKLTECELRRDGEDTVYVCRHGCQVLVVVSVPSGTAWPGRGYRLGDHVIRNASDLLLALPGTAAKVLIPASPAALMRKRP